MTTFLMSVLPWLGTAVMVALASLRVDPPREARRPAELIAAVRAAGPGRCALGTLAATAGLGLLLLAELLRIARATADALKAASDWSAAYIETLWADSQARRANSTTLEVAK